jgi:hypothetical protein
LLIACGGFEARALQVAELIRPERVTRAVILEYIPFDPRNRPGLLEKALGRINCRTERITFNRFQPDGFPERLRDAVINARPERMLVDVSAMSKLAMLLVLRLCADMDVPVTILYTEAQEYGPSEGAYTRARQARNLQPPSIHAYTGVRGTIRVPQFASVAMQGQPTAAIAFMSFNEQLTQALINAVYPSRLILVNGRPPRLTWREAATAWIHSQLRAEWPEYDNPLDSAGLPCRVSSTLHYGQTVALLTELYWTLSVTNRVMLAPTGSKMQTLACFIVASVHRDIHVEYPTPKGFLDTYSEGIGGSWIVEIPGLGGLVSELRNRERARYIGFMPASFGA